LEMLTVFRYAFSVYDAFMLQVLDQMMIGMILRPAFRSDVALDYLTCSDVQSCLCFL